MAVYLASRGFAVGVHYASSEKGAWETVQIIQSAGGVAKTIQADLMEDSQTEDLFKSATDLLGGPITCLVNNASICNFDTVESATRESWDMHMQSNLRAPFLFTRAMAAQNLEEFLDDAGEPAPAGLIVNTIDQSVRKLSPEINTHALARRGA